MNDNAIIKLTTNAQEALQLVADGYIPIEATYGEISCHSREDELLTLDHHNDFSDLECPAFRAQAEMFGKGNGKYVLSHLDNDSVMTVLGLEGIKIPLDLIEAVKFNDTMGPHKVPKEKIYSALQARTQLMNEVCCDAQRYIDGPGALATLCDKICEMIAWEDDHPEIQRFIAVDRARRHKVRRLYSLWADDIRIAHTSLDEYPMDVLYEVSPVVVFHSPARKAFTIGCIDEAVATKLFGDGGLKRVFPILGVGFGGRESVGGSPRGEELHYEMVSYICSKLQMMIKINDEVSVYPDYESCRSYENWSAMCKRAYNPSNNKSEEVWYHGFKVLDMALEPSGNGLIVKTYTSHGSSSHLMEQ